jgi:dihydroorotase-like cyclic amidohydrolase
MTNGPTRLAGLPSKGSIEPGKDADLVAFAPDERFTVGTLQHRNPVTSTPGREVWSGAPWRVADSPTAPRSAA